ncbi:SUMF1/EgtB/PvdO family nonheme iron enzyme [Chitinophaga sp. MM2321]|uniref:formylglycine-generating enzyme family protein n=1 Tax=Chitinophaga sp. MM2321 TaxID=3137178 RepID=UPI0032D586FF
MISKTYLKGVGPTYADVQGRVYIEGSSAIEQRGVCWVLKNTAGPGETLQFPTITNDTMNIDGSTGLVNVRIRGLVPDTAYFACFYAKNSEGIKYSYPVLIRTPAIPDGFVFVEGGDFEMGNILGEDDEKPVHMVTLENYFIAAKEVTNTQYCKFLNEIELAADGSDGGMKYIDMGHAETLITHNGTQFIPVAGFENYPAIRISWYGAKAYCNWAGGRLPTEAEWEFAARGGIKSTGFVYAGSNAPGDVAWYAANAAGKLHPGGEKTANELGTYDMNGNVWEWCDDWYDASYYGGSPVEKPGGPSSGADKVLRGGSYLEGARYTTSRFRDKPEATTSNIGFRVKIAI